MDWRHLMLLLIILSSGIQCSCATERRDYELEIFNNRHKFNYNLPSHRNDSYEWDNKAKRKEKRNVG